MSIITTNSGGVSANIYHLPELPMSFEIESKKVLKKVGEARSALAELKGVTAIIPNENILMSTLPLQEAQDSSEIENIITTQDDLYKSDYDLKQFASVSAKEVHNYAAALRDAFKVVKSTGLLTNNTIKDVQAMLEGNNAGFRSQAGTALKNDKTKEIIYTPPQHAEIIQKFMKNLEEFINDVSKCDWDPLVKMAVIHHQFESIHPFFDGNGRTGRIIIILYLVQMGLLDTPVLYLSRYINRTKNEYYRLLQAIRDIEDNKNLWEDWVVYMLEGVKQTSLQTTQLIQSIKNLMQKHKHKVRSELSKIYSQDLINIIFSHPYTKVHHVEKGLGVSRPTATKYLDELNRIGSLNKIKFGKENYYINMDLMVCLSKVHNM